MSESAPASAEPFSRAQVRFWGTRGTCASPGPRTVHYGGNTPCVEVRGTHAATLVLDAGTGIRALGQHILDHHPEPSRAPGGDNGIHLFITHRHSDHVMGLPHFAPLHARLRNVHVRCGDGDEPGFTAFVASLVSPPLFPYVDGLVAQLHTHDWPEAGGVRAGDFTVLRFPANHPGGAAVIRIDDELGPVLAYAPDNELALANRQPSHQEWLTELRLFLAGIPLLIHDAMYTHRELSGHIGWGHSSAREAVQLALDCRVHNLALFHHHPDRDDDDVIRMVDAAREQVDAVESDLHVFAASEGLTLSF